MICNLFGVSPFNTYKDISLYRFRFRYKIPWQAAGVF